MPFCVQCGRNVAAVDIRLHDGRLLCVDCHRLAVSGSVGLPPAAPSPEMLMYCSAGTYLRQTNSGIGTTALVLGIVSLPVACVPVCGVVAWPISLAGVVLGIVDLCQKNRPHSHALIGLVLSGLCFVLPFVCVVGSLLSGGTSPTPSSMPAAPPVSPAPVVPPPVEAPDAK